jgi:hypothetical protein
VNDDSDGKISLEGIDIYRHRMKEDKAWGIKEHTKIGRKAPNVVRLRSDDKVVFYLCGQKGHRFLGTAKLESGFPLNDLLVHKDFLDWPRGVKLTEIKMWNQTVPIKQLAGELSFFAKGEKNWGSHLQGAITGIPKEDYDKIKDEAL